MSLLGPHTLHELYAISWQKKMKIQLNFIRIYNLRYLLFKKGFEGLEWLPTFY